MRTRLLVGGLSGLLLTSPAVGQVVYQPTPPPLVDAASAVWQVNGEPIFFAG
jgi:hypothetical protein